MEALSEALSLLPPDTELPEDFEASVGDLHVSSLFSALFVIKRCAPAIADIRGRGASRWLIQISFHEFNFAINLVWRENFGILE